MAAEYLQEIDSVRYASSHAPVSSSFFCRCLLFSSFFDNSIVTDQAHSEFVISRSCSVVTAFVAVLLACFPASLSCNVFSGHLSVQFDIKTNP